MECIASQNAVKPMMNSVYKNHGSWPLLVSKSEFIDDVFDQNVFICNTPEFFLKLFVILDAKHLLDFVQQLRRPSRLSFNHVPVKLEILCAELLSNLLICPGVGIFDHLKWT